MAFVMIATGATSRSRVRTLSVRPLIGAAAALALVLLSTGGALGYWVAAFGPAPHPLPAAAGVEPVAALLPFTLEQLGAISGRLFRLESEAAQLSKRIGGLKSDAAPARTPKRKDEPAPVEAGPAQAGARSSRRMRNGSTSARSTRSSAASSSRSPASPASPRSARSSRCACRRACRSPAPS